jgi:hypothetical protein
VNESAKYAKIVEWSNEDQCYVGSAPGLIYGGCLLARARGNEGGRPFSQNPRKLISLRLPADVNRTIHARRTSSASASATSIDS